MNRCFGYDFCFLYVLILVGMLYYVICGWIFWVFYIMIFYICNVWLNIVVVVVWIISMYLRGVNIYN